MIAGLYSQEFLAMKFFMLSGKWNKCVDVLAAFGRFQDQDFDVIVDTPAMDRKFIVIDKSVVTSSCLVVVS